MARPKKQKKVLLIEPNYANKFPPVGLMKLATYYRNLGNWDVVFYKGDLRLFVIERIADDCIEELSENIEIIDDSESDDHKIEWYAHKETITEYIRTRKNEVLNQLLSQYPNKELQIAFILIKICHSNPPLY